MNKVSEDMKNQANTDVSLNLKKTVASWLNSRWIKESIEVLRTSRLAQVLSGLLVMQLAMASALGLQSGKHADFSTDEPMLALDAGVIESIEIQSKADSIKLVKQDDKWVIDAESAYLADTGRIDSLLSTLVNLQTGLPVASSQNAREQLQVADERYQRRITLDGKAMESTSLLLGTSPGLRKAHLRREDRDEIYSVSLPVSDVPITTDSWLDKTQLAFNDITAIRSDVLSLQRSGEGDNMVWNAIQPTSQDQPLDTVKLDSVLQTMHNLRVIGLVQPPADSGSSGELNEITNITVETTDGETTVTLSGANEQLTVARSDRNGVFELSSAQYEQLIALASEDGWFLATEVNSEQGNVEQSASVN